MLALFLASGAWAETPTPEPENPYKSPAWPSEISAEEFWTTLRDAHTEADANAAVAEGKKAGVNLDVVVARKGLRDLAQLSPIAQNVLFRGVKRQTITDLRQDPTRFSLVGETSDNELSRMRGAQRQVLQSEVFQTFQEFDHTNELKNALTLFVGGVVSPAITIAALMDGNAEHRWMSVVTALTMALSASTVSYMLDRGRDLWNKTHSLAAVNDAVEAAAGTLSRPQFNRFYNNVRGGILERKFCLPEYESIESGAAGHPAN